MSSIRLHPFARLAGAALVLFASADAPTAADDRQLLSSGTAEPFVFLLLDTSGSMNLSPRMYCRPDQVAAGLCSVLDTSSGSAPGTTCSVAEVRAAWEEMAGENPPQNPDSCYFWCPANPTPVVGDPDDDRYNRVRCFHCPQGNCTPRRMGDDSLSKFRAAKEALFEVMSNPRFEHMWYGFAGYDHDRMRVRGKHWWYRPSRGQDVGEGPIQLRPNGPAFPPTTWRDAFGPRYGQSCGSSATGLDGVGCVPENPAVLNTWSATAGATVWDNGRLPWTWAASRVQLLPKNLEATNGSVGDTSTSTTFYISENRTTYRVTYSPGSGGVSLGDLYVKVNVAIARCDNAACTATTAIGPAGGRAVRFKAWSANQDDDLDGVQSTPEFLFYQPGADETDCRQGQTPTPGPNATPSSTCPLVTYFDDRFNDVVVTAPRVPACATGDVKGWEDNPDLATTDPFALGAGGPGYDLKFPGNTDIYRPAVAPDPLTMRWQRPEFFTYGDRLPLDWMSNNKGRVLDRLMPNRQDPDPCERGTAPVRGFQTACYFDNQRLAGETFLRLEDDFTKLNDGGVDDIRPLVAAGGSPLGPAIDDFRVWHSGCANGNCQGTVSWSDIAAAEDPFAGCRQKYLIILTDGVENCGRTGGNNPCTATASMRAQEQIYTYTIAFGIPAGDNRLGCLSANTQPGGAPIFPNSKEQLVTELTRIFDQILERTSTFASAAVPSVQATVADKIYLTNFTPIQGASVWAGRLQAFLKPLPLDQFGAPDTAIVCGGTVQSKCFLWDAGDVQVDPDYTPDRLLLQAPRMAEITLPPAGGAAASLLLGAGENQRRVLYHRPGYAGRLRLFAYPEAGTDVTTSGDEHDLWSAMGLSTAAADIPSSRTAANAAIKFLLGEKQADITNPLTGTTYHVHYLMGDVFHSDPVVVESPTDSLFYKQDLYNRTSDPNRCGANYSLPGGVPEPGYRAFAQRHACRRKMVLVGANDGQLHAFDTGTWQLDECDPTTTTLGFSNGTGKELFSFLPRTVLPTVEQLSPPHAHQEWSVDGRVRVDSVFIDPVPPGAPRCDHRAWRTVAVGSLREGGRAYFALDLTQPDTLDADNVPTAGAGAYVPSCTGLAAETGQMTVPEGCGPLPFPALLWEFTDPWDEDDEGDDEWAGDLAETWSQATIGRIRVCKENRECSDAANVEDRFVAVFGGGVPDEYLGIGQTSGDWLYMVDIETGKTLYKRPLEGSAPAPAAAVDTDQNGYLDTIYIGTTAGFLYKVNLGPAGNPLPIVDTTVCDYRTDPCTQHTVPRIVASYTRPFKIFSTGGLPLYMETTVIYVAQLQRYALAFGTGNRRSLWDMDGLQGRFYLLLDTNFQDAVAPFGENDTGVKTEADYYAPGDAACIDPESAFDPTTPDYLFDTTDTAPGWCLRLLPNEKVIADPFAITGITSFTSYIPDTTANADGTCSRTGESRIWVVKTTNANPYIFPDPTNPNARSRYSVISDFTTQPFAEQSTTKNPSSGDDSRTTADQLCSTPAMSVMREELKRLFPEGCKFTNWTIDVKTIRSDTGLVCVAPIPQCVLPHNWKEY